MSTVSRKLSFQQQALTLGYETEESMFKDLYSIQGFSIKEIGKIVGVAGWVVRNRLIGFRVPLRRRGGVNNYGNRKLVNVTDLELEEMKAKAIAEKYKVHLSTVFAEIRTRKRERGDFNTLPARQDRPAEQTGVGGVPAADSKPDLCGTLSVREAKQGKTIHDKEGGGGQGV